MNMHILQRGESLPVDPVPEAREWYLLDVYAGREAQVMRWFRYFGLDGWYPVEISYIRRGDGGVARKPHLGRRIARPLVPGLIFVLGTGMTDETAVRMLSIPGVDGFHRIGDCLARMSEKDMAKLRDIEAYLNMPRGVRGVRGKLSIGEAIRVIDGPFSSFIGRLERLDSKGRLTVLIDAFKRSVSLQMDETQIEPIGSTPRG